MGALVIALRIVHIFGGVFWGGAIFTLVLFLQPAIKAAGPAGGQVMQRLAAMRFLVVVPLMAALTVLSGLALFWHDSGGSAAFMGTPTGIALSVGGTSAIIAFLIGLFAMRPATMRLLEIGRAAQAAGGTPTAEQQAEIPALQKKARTAAVGVSHLVGIAVIAMAVARYV